MSAREDGPFHIYRCYDADDRLIYVGCTAFLWRRQREHRDTSWWTPQVVRVTAKLHRLPKKEARSIERQVIATEQPRWNTTIRHMFRNDWTPGDYEDYLRARRQSGVKEDRVALGLPLKGLEDPMYSRAVKLQAECLRKFGTHLDIGPPPKSFRLVLVTDRSHRDRRTA